MARRIAKAKLGLSTAALLTPSGTLPEEVTVAARPDPCAGKGRAGTRHDSIAKGTQSKEAWLKLRACAEELDPHKLPSSAR